MSRVINARQWKPSRIWHFIRFANDFLYSWICVYYVVTVYTGKAPFTTFYFDIFLSHMHCLIVVF